MNEKQYNKALKIVQNSNRKHIDRLSITPYGSSGFETLQDFAGQALKMLFLANGGASIALLTLAGAMLTKEDTRSLIPKLIGPTIFFCGGIISIAISAYYGMRSQKYFNKPILADDNASNIRLVARNLQKGKSLQTKGIGWAMISASMFILGCSGGIFIFSGTLF